MAIKEKKMDKQQKIRFEAIAKIANVKALKNSELKLKLYEQVMGSKKLILVQKDVAEYDAENKIYKFPGL